MLTIWEYDGKLTLWRQPAVRFEAALG